MKWILCFSLLFFSLSLIGQTQVLKGTIKSGHYKKALNRAHVRSGTRSDKTDHDGKFEVVITPYTPLIISCNGYDNLQIPYEEIGTFNPFEVYLTPSSSSFTSVQKNESVQRIHAAKFEQIRDYLFMNDTLLVLSYMNSQSEGFRSGRRYRNCALSFFNYGALVERLILPDNVNRIRRDVNGGIYLVGGDFVKFLNRENNDLKIDDFDYEVFRTQIDPIFARSDRSYFYREYFDVIPLLRIVEYLPQKDKSRIVRSFKNREYFLYVNKDFAMLNPTERTMAEELEAETQINKALFAPYIRSFYLDRSTSLPGVRGYTHGDSLVLFDFMNRKAYFENLLDSKTDSIGIFNFDLEREDLLSVLRDTGTNAYYALHERAGITYLRRLDLATMSLGRPFKLFYPFPERIKLIDGYVYYLHKPPKEMGEKVLLREVLLN